MSAHTEDEIDIVQILAIFRRQLRLIVLTAGITIALAFVYLSQATPLYTATTLLLVDPAGKDVLSSEAAATSSVADNARLGSEVEILKSDSLAIKTIRDSKLFLTDEFGVSLGLVDKIKIALGLESSQLPEGDEVLRNALTKFQDALDVQRRGLTYLIAVSVTSEVPERAAELANAHARTYIADQIAAKVEGSLGARDVLQSQLDQARQALSDSDGALSAYIEANIDRLEQESGSTQIADLRRQLLNANDEISQITRTRDLAQSALQNGDWERLAAEINDETIAQLAQQQQAFEQKLSGVSEGSAEAIDISAGLAEVNRQLTEVGAQRLADIDQSVQAQLEGNSEIAKSIRSEVLNSTLSPATLTDIYSLQQEAQIAQRQYDTLLQRVREVQTQALLQIADTRVVSEALSPRLPSYPKTKLSLALAVALGLGLGAMLALANEYLFGGVNSAEQLGNIVPAKVGSVISKVTMKEGQLSCADKVVDEPMSQFAESFRKLRASIDRQSPEKQGIGKVILVTSSIPAEGKSTDALALARTYALAGKRTVLIDADLRKPSQHTYIGISPETGILEYLTGEIPKGEEVAFYEADPKSTVGVILGRRRSSIPTDAPLQSQAFSELIANARSSLEVIIIDSAPLIPVVDARYIVPHVDAVVLCVRYGLTRQADVRTAYEQLAESAGENTVIMTSLNCFEDKQREYRYSGYYGYNS